VYIKVVWYQNSLLEQLSGVKLVWHKRCLMVAMVVVVVLRMVVMVMVLLLLLLLLLLRLIVSKTVLEDSL